MIKGEIFKEVSELVTSKGDEVYFDGKEVKIFNIPFRSSPSLRLS